MSFKKEVYTYKAPWLVYATNWTVRQDKPMRLAIASFKEEYMNEIELLRVQESTGEFEKLSKLDHPFPPTKLMFIPDKEGKMRDLFASTSDSLRIWTIKEDNTIESFKTLHNNKSSELCAPLTSFDWSESDIETIGTSSIDTTCTIWNIERGTSVIQLIAHDKEVFDIAFSPHKYLFASVGGDGSVRLFDIRSLDTSTILYETSNPKTSLLRLAWNKQNANYIATFMTDSPKAIILDIRYPSHPTAELSGHQACLNSIAWAPHSFGHICTAGDDRKALMWDISNIPNNVQEQPFSAYTAEGAINSLQWSTGDPNWLSIAFGRSIQVLGI
jgi:WD repeat-containing protein 68